MKAIRLSRLPRIRIIKNGGLESSDGFDRILGRSGCGLIQFVNEMAVFQCRVCDARPMAVRALDAPGTAAPDERHLTAASPPLMDIPRQCVPELPFGTQVTQVCQQIEVDRTGAPLDDIVRMDEKADETVARQNQLDLLLPPGYRIVSKDVEKRIVL